MGNAASRTDREQRDRDLILGKSPQQRVDTDQSQVSSGTNHYPRPPRSAAANTRGNEDAYSRQESSERQQEIFNSHLLEQNRASIELKGGRYAGDLVEGKPHGQGFLMSYNGEIYDGQFEDGLRHGKGRIIYKDGSEFEGVFDGDVRHGKGKMRDANGDVFDGMFQDDVKEGPGVFRYVTGEEFKGDWKEDILTKGTGVIKDANGIRDLTKALNLIGVKPAV